ncbi:MAG TPA: hypothetical protein VNT60_09995 [Deinococcales bacterium]|nr:hypothetical protein [Deinococcales bacterium]
MIKVVRAVGAGLLGGTAMEAWGFLTYQAGLTPLSMSRYEGGMVTGRLDDPGSRAAGIGAHMLLSAAIALPYAAIMDRTRRSGPAVGLQLGVLHWAVASLVLPGLDSLSPAVREGRAPALRSFASGYGSSTAIMFLAGHLLYGAVVGAAYDPQGSE